MCNKGKKFNKGKKPTGFLTPYMKTSDVLKLEGKSVLGISNTRECNTWNKEVERVKVKGVLG